MTTTVPIVPTPPHSSPPVMEPHRREMAQAGHASAMSLLLLLLVALIAAASSAAAAPVPSSASPSAAEHLQRMDANSTAPRKWFSACVTPGAPDIPSPSHASGATAASPFGSPAAHQAAAPLTRVPALHLVPGRDQSESCLAWGWFSDDIPATGWGYLYVESQRSASASLQSYAAGWIEGALTSERLLQHAQNTLEMTFGPSMEPRAPTAHWVEQQVVYNRAQIQAPTSAFWTEMANVLTQLQGLAEGYNSAAPADRQLTPLQLIYLQLAPDLEDIIPAAEPDQRPDPSTMTLTEVLALEQRRSHCSAIVKITKNGELFHAHNTWWNYGSMLRIFKLTVLPLPGSVGRTVHFSSYPGMLSSMDDYYTIAETRLSVTETTNEINNPKMYELCQSRAVAPWARVMVANRRAVNGKDWIRWFAQENSGTYNNQWMIVDHTLYEPHAPLRDGLMHIVTQQPGLFLDQDVTHVLRTQSYWPSYNRPYERRIFEDMGFAALQQRFGDYLYSYNNSFRALIFRREQENIHTLEDVQRVITLNRWQTDPLSHNCSGLALAARNDLATEYPSTMPGGANGMTDAKITCSSWMREDGKRVLAISGPTHVDQVPFAWKGVWEDTPHRGHPDVFDFDWVTLPPKEMRQQGQQQEQVQPAPSIATE